MAGWPRLYDFQMKYMSAPPIQPVNSQPSLMPYTTDIQQKTHYMGQDVQFQQAPTMIQSYPASSQGVPPETFNYGAPQQSVSTAFPTVRTYTQYPESVPPMALPSEGMNPPAPEIMSMSEPPGVSQAIVLPPAPNYSLIPVKEREEEIVEFWRRRFIHVRPGEEPPFPDKFALRLIVGLDKRAGEGLEALFKDQKKRRLEFQADPPCTTESVPPHLRCVARCKWPKQRWVIGYGATTKEAENEAAFGSLKRLISREELTQILEMNRPERYIGIDIQRVAQDLNKLILVPGSSSAPSEYDLQQPAMKISRVSPEGESLESSKSQTVAGETQINTRLSEDKDSDHSIGGSESDLTGDEDEEDFACLPPTKKALIQQRKDLFARENRIIKYWWTKRPPRSLKPFPDIYRLRNLRNVQQKTKQAVGVLFQSLPIHQRPIFQNAPNTRPDLGYFHVRCSWDNFKVNIYGYGNTPESAGNDAGMQALIKLLGDQEYQQLCEMTHDSLYAGVNMIRINAHIGYKPRHSLPPIHHRFPCSESFRMETELINYTKVLPIFPSVFSENFAVPKPSFQLQFKKLRHYGKSLDASAKPSFQTTDKIAAFQNFEKLESISNIGDNAVSALGYLFAEVEDEPTPSYICLLTGRLNKETYKVECTARGKYFVAVGPTEEMAKNQAALSALKFLVGEERLQKLISKSEQPKLKS